MIDYNVSGHADVVFDKNYQESKSYLLNHYNNLENFYSLGRFGEWEYYNMDVYIKKALELSKKISRLEPA